MIFFVVYVKKSSTFAPALKETLKNVVKESWKKRYGKHKKKIKIFKKKFVWTEK